MAAVAIQQPGPSCCDEAGDECAHKGPSRDNHGDDSKDKVASNPAGRLAKKSRLSPARPPPRVQTQYVRKRWRSPCANAQTLLPVAHIVQLPPERFQVPLKAQAPGRNGSNERPCISHQWPTWSPCSNPPYVVLSFASELVGPRVGVLGTANRNDRRRLNCPGTAANRPIQRCTVWPERLRNATACSQSGVGTPVIEGRALAHCNDRSHEKAPLERGMICLAVVIVQSRPQLDFPRYRG